MCLNQEMEQQEIRPDDLAKIAGETWMYIIRYHDDFMWNFMALKIILARLNLLMIRHGQSVEEQCCEGLRDLFRQGAHIPHAQEDLQQIRLLNTRLQNEKQA